MGAPFDPAMAVRLGRLVQEAYAMFGADPHNVTPPVTSSFPIGYHLAGWVTMQDFFFEGTTRVFYGIIAQDLGQPNRFVLAIRGTSTWVEWWDDLLSVELVPFKDGSLGRAGTGFVTIYDTLEVLESTPGSAAPAVSLQGQGGFAAQIAELIRRKRGTVPSGVRSEAASVEVAGHSLGSALATLYVQDNTQAGRLPVSAIYTFASPRVGDYQFVRVFDALPIVSWRVANDLDIVTWVPIAGFQHVAAVKPLIPWNIVLSPGCMHALATYLSLLDPALQPDAACQLSFQQAMQHAPDWA